MNHFSHNFIAICSQIHQYKFAFFPLPVVSNFFRLVLVAYTLAVNSVWPYFHRFDAIIVVALFVWNCFVYSFEPSSFRSCRFISLMDKPEAARDKESFRETRTGTRAVLGDIRMEGSCCVRNNTQRSAALYGNDARRGGVMQHCS